MHKLPLPFLALALLACGDDMPGGVDSSLACDCPDPTAAQVPYDNAGSGLTGTDVQDAIDELAATPAPAPDAYGRIVLQEDTFVASPGAAVRSNTIGCPNGGLALGGSCSGGDENVSLQATELQGAGFTCTWHKPFDATYTLFIKVTCLMPAEE